MRTFPSAFRSAPARRTLARLLSPVLRRRLMRFPTFPGDLNQELSARADYFRFATLGLAVRRVESDGIPGALAEVGVWRGEVTRILHALAPGRPYYLFDTFEGFPEDQLEPGAGVDRRFRDTSVETVLANIGDTSNIHIRAGRVPETLGGLDDERFAFVLLDLDLHEPTVASLEFFYPRLAQGGFLIVHDYNNPESGWACKRALDAFMEERPESVVEIADNWGTAIVRRS